ncbi:prepilin peptidase [Zhaonella formicivorans]|uniref:prepilin peptidase n=1 Tax=Zhaonella formicivorans TaxID=2528593 RepID=UPI0010D3DA9C|nr:prepilin peptidase [Zhaonella formicivorans]
MLPVLGLLGYLSYVDIKKREVPDAAVLALFLYSLFVLLFNADRWGMVIGHALLSFKVFISFLLLAFVTQRGFGGGDIKLISALAFFLGDNFFLLAAPAAILMFFTLVWAFGTGKGFRYEIPFVPYIFLSYLTVCVVRTYMGA